MNDASEQVQIKNQEIHDILDKMSSRPKTKNEPYLDTEESGFKGNT